MKLLEIIKEDSTHMVSQIMVFRNGYDNQWTAEAYSNGNAEFRTQDTDPFKALEKLSQVLKNAKVSFPRKEKEDYGI